MSQVISVLVLRLEAVLQSWGEYSKWNTRDSATIPTKSAIIGLLGCVLDSRLVSLSDQLQMVVRVDRSGRLINDFHTVTAKKMINAEGKRRTGGNTLVTNRYYLQDACFTVFLIGEKDLLYKLENALKFPKWPLFLGRKCCVPSRPVLDGTVKEFSSIKDALNSVSFADRADSLIFVETDELIDGFDGISLQRMDSLKEGFREFQYRSVIRCVLPKVKVE